MSQQVPVAGETLDTEDWQAGRTIDHCVLMMPSIIFKMFESVRMTVGAHPGKKPAQTDARLKTAPREEVY